MSDSDARDFAIDADDLLPGADPGPESEPSPAASLSPTPSPTTIDPEPAAAPRVVIEYRNRGLHSALLPPLLILLVALVIMSYQRQTRLRPVAPRPVATKADEPEGPGRLIMVDSSATGAAVDPITVRASTQAPTLPAPVFAPDSIATPRPALPRLPEPEPEPEPEPAPEPEPTAGPEAEIALAHADQRVEPGPFSPLGGEPADQGGDRPEPAPGPEIAEKDEPPLTPPAPLAMARGEVLPADSPELAFHAGDDQAPGAPLAEPEPEPKLSKEEILQEIQAEAQQKQVEQRNLQREMALAQLREHQELIRKAHEDRVAFHRDLRRLLKAMGDGAGEEINAACDRYGRSTDPKVYDAVVMGLSKGTGPFRWAARLDQGAKINLMRSLGFPEPVILDYLANALHKTINTRGGPRDRNQVIARAALRLLSYPPPQPPQARAPARAQSQPPSPPTPVSRSVAGVAAPPVPQPVRPAQ